MNFNKIIFPAPESSYKTLPIENVIWIPRNSNQRGGINTLDVVDLKAKTSSTQKNMMTLLNRFSLTTDCNSKKLDIIENEDEAIPCLYLPFSEGSDKVLIYFHGNADDIGWGYSFTSSLRDQLSVNVVSVEYPGYGLYVGEPSAERILEDSKIVFDFLQYQIGVPPDNIILFGRSIGSGPATYLASRRDVGALILMSPCTSIKAVAHEVAGKLGSLIVAERFENIEEIKKANCPVFFIHGKKDTLVPFIHTVDLSLNVPGYCGVSLPAEMTHDTFIMEEHLTIPILRFFFKCRYRIKVGKQPYEVPAYLYVQPESMKGKKNQRTIISRLLYPDKIKTHNFKLQPESATQQ